MKKTFTAAALAAMMLATAACGNTKLNEEE